MELQQLPKDDFGGFGRRALATFVDLVILVVPISLIELQLQVLLDGTTPGAVKPSFLAQFIAVYGTWALYEIPFWASPWRATPGKRVCGLVVTNMQGERLSLSRAIARYGAKVVSGLVVIGVFFILSTTFRQALHDLMAKTLVLKRRAIIQDERT